MLAMYECFLIKFTIPKLLDEKILRKNLLKEEFLNLKTIVEKNAKLRSEKNHNSCAIMFFVLYPFMIHATEKMSNALHELNKVVYQNNLKSMQIIR